MCLENKVITELSVLLACFPISLLDQVFMPANMLESAFVFRQVYLSLTYFQLLHRNEAGSERY